MGALTTVALIPNLIFSLHAGSWVDRRGGRRQVMLVADVCRGVLIGTIPVAYALGHLTWTQLYVVAFGSGVLSVFFYVAYGGFFQTIVEREDYVAANSLTHGSRAFSFLAGTSIGGVLVQVLRGPYALAIDAVSFLWSALFLGRIHSVDPPAGPESTGGIMAGARWIRHNAIIRAELLGVATLNFFNFIYFALFLLYATRELNVQPAALGIVLGAASVGTLLGSVITGRISRRFGVGPAFLFGCFLFPRRSSWCRSPAGRTGSCSACLFTAEFLSGIGLMLLDILAGAISAGAHPAHAALTCLRRVHAREQRHPAGRHRGRRGARDGDRPAADPVDRDGRRALGDAVPAAVADPLAARRPGGGPRVTAPDPLTLFHEWVDGDQMAIATATPDGRPSVRMLLLKSADERGFTFFTGYTSRKGRELEANPRAALLFHRPGIQVRVEGRVERLTAAESDAYWATRPAASTDGAQRLRSSRSRSGRVRSSRLRSQRSPPEPPRPERWGGFRLVPDTYEFWRHRDDRLHERHLYRACDDGWESLLLQP